MRTWGLLPDPAAAAAADEDDEDVVDKRHGSSSLYADDEEVAVVVSVSVDVDGGVLTRVLPPSETSSDSTELYLDRT